MKDSGCRMIEDHSRPRIAHHQPDALFHILAVTMHRAFAATGLVLAERTIRQTLPGILQQSRAIGTQLPIALPMSAIYPNHLRHSLLFTFNSCHFVDVCTLFMRSILASV